MFNAIVIIPFIYLVNSIGFFQNILKKSKISQNIVQNFKSKNYKSHSYKHKHYANYIQKDNYYSDSFTRDYNNDDTININYLNKPVQHYTIENCCWILDSGASINIAIELDKLINIKKCNDKFLQ